MIHNSQNDLCSTNGQIKVTMSFQMQDQHKNYLSIQDDQYISNFLVGQIDLYQGDQKPQSPFNEPIFQQIIQQNQEIGCNNVQKHIYVTIKQLLKLNQKVGDEYIQQSMKILWNAFVNSPKKSKQSLLVIFGYFDQNSSQDIELFSSLNLHISMFLNAEIIRIAQYLIRNQAIQQLTEDRIKRHVEQRRVKKKDDFLRSLIKFVNKLKSGCLRKRKSDKISKKIKPAL